MTVKDLQAVFAKCKAENRAAFVPYVTAGFPSKDATVEQMLALQEGGADIIELGMPFSDPMADGPTIQASSFAALAQGVVLKDCFEFTKQARKRGLTCPVILMGYCNPFVQHGEENLVNDSADATISGFIVVDLSGREAVQFAKTCAKRDLAYVPLVAPTSTDKRLAEIGAYASGYVYCVSVAGVTGARDELPEDLGDFCKRVKKHFTVPLCVGFGLNKRSHVTQVAKVAEGAVIGSQIIKTIEAAGSDVKAQCDALRSYAKSVTTD
uniref:tryptophan synthase n=1 Tax=Mucochytrium quahogii TaxID=96639 RepID=A0A7S2WBY2_9STRA|mmetsp:Transcript_17793/g.28797  ORF Transcript_17793/g.28797 Transcript_17793/m.28797 type:complete len:267 (+) Transcript_17793:230-1030(+)